MTKLKIILAIVFSFGLSNGFAQKVSNGAYNLMLKTLLSHNVNEVDVYNIDTTEEIIFLDSREKEEYKVSHIKNAIWVGYNDFDIERVKNVDKDKKIVVYCSVGKRSEDITEKLMKAGYKNVSNLYGGIFEWVNNDKPVYKDQEITKQVHAYNKTWGIWLSKGEKVYNTNKN